VDPDEEEVKKDDKLMEEEGKSRGGRLGEGVILTRRGTVRRLCPHHYSITASTWHSIPHPAPFRAQNRPKPRVAFQLRGKEKEWGNDVGPTCQRQQPNCVTFSISIYCFLTWSRHLLQPSTFIAFFNFNPRHQLHPSSLSTSILVTNIIPRRQLQPSPPFNFQTLSLFYFLPFSLMPEVCLMLLLLPDELVT
jgi:hypothetical protein